MIDSANVKGDIHILWDGEIPYIELYIIDNRLAEREEHTFIIKEGYAMSSDKEALLATYCGIVYVQMDEEKFNQVFECFSQRYPAIHLHRYETGGHIVAHIYFSLNTRGVREILFKANLDLLAAALDKIADYNMIGSSPEDIFELPLKALRSLNRSWKGLYLMDTELKRRILYDVYMHYAGDIQDWNSINALQWKYLMKKYYDKEKFDHKTLAFLSNKYFEQDLAELLQYQERVEVIAEYADLPWVPVCNEDGEYECYDIAESVFHTCVLYKKYYNQRLEMQYMDGGYLLEVQEERYQVEFPKSVKAITEEARRMRNCLAMCIKQISNRDTIILFVTDSVTGEKADLEINENMEIVQCFGKQNTLLSDEFMKWIKVFLEQKKQKYADEIDALFRVRQFNIPIWED